MQETQLPAGFILWILQVFQVLQVCNAQQKAFSTLRAKVGGTLFNVGSEEWVTLINVKAQQDLSPRWENKEEQTVVDSVHVSLECRRTLSCPLGSCIAQCGPNGDLCRVTTVRSKVQYWA